MAPQEYCGFEQASSAGSDATTEWTAEDVHTIGASIKEKLGLINKLSELGIEHNNGINIPKIVVVGDQSAGKSSLIEAISQIRVPRSAGTCTRCPMQINLVEAEDPAAAWKCTIYLHKAYDYAPSASVDPNQKYDFGPWRLRSIEDSDAVFQELKDPGKVENALRRAQLAILNPHKPMSVYANPHADLDEEIHASFSPNVVRLDIEGPDLPNLSFYDLPGVVNQTASESESRDVKVVKNLMKDYIQRPQTIVLLACSLENDLQNSTAARIVRKCDADKRCLGVLTKPDRIEHGNNGHDLTKVLAGDQFELGYGYFVTKQPGQKELNEGITHKAAREAESAFWRRKKLWLDLDDRFPNQLGTNNLQKRLSSLLGGKIADCIPDLIETIDSKLRMTQEALEEIPEPNNQAFQLTVLRLLDGFKKDVDSAVKGDGNSLTLLHEKSDKLNNLQMSLAKMRPTLWCITSEEREQTERKPVNNMPSPADSQDPIEVLDESDVDITPSRSRKRPAPGSASTSAFQTPVKHPRGSTATPAPSARNGTSALVARTLPAEEKLTVTKDLSKHFSLEELYETISMMSTDSITASTPHPKCHEAVIRTCIEHLAKPVDGFFSDLSKTVKETLRGMMQKRVHQWACTKLSEEAPRCVDRFLQGRFEEAKKAIDRLVMLELNKPVARNAAQQKKQESEALKKYTDARNKARVQAAITKYELDHHNRVLAKEAMQKKVNDFDVSKLEPDQYRRELEVMAVVSAYYNMATERLVDNIAQAIEFEIFDKLCEPLHDFMLEDLHIAGRDAYDRCQELLSEDPWRTRRRQQLCRDQTRLLEARSHLSRISAA